MSLFLLKLFKVSFCQRRVNVFNLIERSYVGVSPGEGVLPYMGYIGMCGPKGYGFSAILVINRVWFLHSSLDIFKKKPLFIIIEKKSTKARHKLCLQ